MGAAASVPEGDGAAPPAPKTDTHKALVYDTVYSNFEQRLLPKPGSKPKPPAANAPKRNSLFAEKAPAPVADPAAEPEPEPDPAGMASYEGPFFQDLDANAKDALIVEMRTTAQLIEQQISDGTWPAPEKPPDELHYKMDVASRRAVAPPSRCRRAAVWPLSVHPSRVFGPRRWAYGLHRPAAASPPSGL